MYYNSATFVTRKNLPQCCTLQILHQQLFNGSIRFRLLVCNQRITVVQNAKLITARPMMIRMKMYPAPIRNYQRKNIYFLSTILKINYAMDKNYKDKAEKEPGFNRLEEHRKNLILNASATPPFDEKASQPTEFFTAFLSKKSQFKAKDMLVDRLQSEKICFNPGSSFIKL
jgi:hypothetical protein